jgi:hypothetical protein
MDKDNDIHLKRVERGRIDSLCYDTYTVLNLLNNGTKIIGITKSNNKKKPFTFEDNINFYYRKDYIVVCTPTHLKFYNIDTEKLEYTIPAIVYANVTGLCFDSPNVYSIVYDFDVTNLGGTVKYKLLGNKKYEAENIVHINYKGKGIIAPMPVDTDYAYNLLCNLGINKPQSYKNENFVYRDNYLYRHYMDYADTEYFVGKGIVIKQRLLLTTNQYTEPLIIYKKA